MTLRSTKKNIADHLAALEAKRLRLHRLSPCRPIKSAAEAARFVKNRWVAVLMGGGGIAVLTNAIAGRQLPGSWMAHPEAKLIYDILTALEEFDLGSIKIGGKWAFIDPLLGPAIVRIATDEERRAQILEELPAAASQLLKRVDTEGSFPMESSELPTKDGRRARLILEDHLLVESRSVHTERGSHTVVLYPWDATVFAQKFRAAAKQLTLRAAEETMVEACLHSAVVIPEKEANRWFSFAPTRIEAMVAGGQIERFEIGRKWLTLPAR